ncbi:MAG: hypothetical protein V1884_00515, partial [Candidatus Omnitrophota bacterium]
MNIKKLFSRHKEPMTLEEYVKDCLAKGETKEDLQKRLLGDLDKGEGIFKDFKEFIKPTFPDSVSRFNDSEVSSEEMLDNRYVWSSVLLAKTCDD